jgi:hypothetical protein
MSGTASPSAPFTPLLLSLTPLPNFPSGIEKKIKIPKRNLRGNKRDAYSSSMSSR